MIFKVRKRGKEKRKGRRKGNSSKGKETKKGEHKGKRTQSTEFPV